jgi:hypothetical protein
MFPICVESDVLYHISPSFTKQRTAEVVIEMESRAQPGYASDDREWYDWRGKDPAHVYLRLQMDEVDRCRASGRLLRSPGRRPTTAILCTTAAGCSDYQPQPPQSAQRGGCAADTEDPVAALASREKAMTGRGALNGTGAAVSETTHSFVNVPLIASMACA